MSADVIGGRGSLRIERAGMRTLIQDLGRPGQAHLGISASGAWDRAAHRLANRLVGNPEAAATLEILMGGLEAAAVGEDLLVAVTGAPVALAIDARPVDAHSPLLLRDGQRLVMGRPTQGLRTHLAVRGGIDAPRVFGSMASDPTRHIGPEPVADGDLLAVGGCTPGALQATDLAVSAGSTPGELTLHCLLGPRDDWFTPAALEVFATQRWTVTPQADRVGSRLEAAIPLERAITKELSSEAIVRGAVQVPASGQPLVFGPDHPTTGGYPVIAVVDEDDADRLAQATPGTQVRFAPRRDRLLL